MMLLFKASGATYHRVVKKRLHAFRDLPKGHSEGEFVLLSKNRADCRDLEKQVQYAAKLKQFRKPMPGELERAFPGVGAASRWTYVADLCWVKEFTTHFNLSDINGLNHQRYRTVQDFARLSESDSRALMRYLAETNAAVLVDFLNNDDCPADER